MRLYTAMFQRVRCGIPVNDGVVEVGQEGRGRSMERIPVGPPDPDLQGGHVRRAALNRVTISSRTYFRLVREGQPTDERRVLILVSAAGPYTKGSEGRITVLRGEVEVLARGWVAWGLAGRAAGYEEQLLLIRGSAVVRVRPAGGHKTSPWVLVVESREDPRVLSQDEWDQAEAHRQADEAGGWETIG